jgi:hypothetical protein
LIAATSLALLWSAPVTALVDGLGEQQATLVRSLDATAATMTDAATAAEGVDQSLDTTAAAARRASALTDSLASSLRTLGASMDLELFGSRPFAALGDDFRLVADEAAAVSTDLGTTADSLDRNRDDTRRIAADFRALRIEVEQLRGLVDQTDLAGGGLVSLRLMLILLVIWQAVPAIAALALGVELLRRQRANGGRSVG